MKTIILILLALSLTGCGYVNRLGSYWTGDGFETCMNGVAYYQFTSGSAVAYNPDGTLKTCQE